MVGHEINGSVGVLQTGVSVGVLQTGVSVGVLQTGVSVHVDVSVDVLQRCDAHQHEQQHEQRHLCQSSLFI